jgi:hypothetical protein
MYWRMLGIIVLSAWITGISLRAEEKKAPQENGLGQSRPSMFQVGEELEYSVHYSFFNIGTVKFKVTDRFEKNGRSIYRAYAFMDSNPSLSWLKDLHIRFYSDIDQDAYTHSWLSEDSTSKKISFRRIAFDYNKLTMNYEWGERLKSGEYRVDGKSVIPISMKCQDGLSLFFFARAHALEKENMRVPTVMDTSILFTNINFGIEKGQEEIDALPYAIDIAKLDGKADFVGVFGLTGAFEGNFTKDDASIPVTARMKVILGSIKVELTKWNRPGWSAPKAIE